MNLRSWPPIISKRRFWQLPPWLITGFISGQKIICMPLEIEKYNPDANLSCYGGEVANPYFSD
jgi:hypothetical protein